MLKKILQGFLPLLFFGFAFSATACFTLDQNVEISDGYGTSYNFFSEEKEQLVKGTCENNYIDIEVGNGSDSVYIYRLGYFYNNNINEWQSVELDGERASDDWILGRANKRVSLDMADGQARHFVAYTCQRIGEEWKCGCADEDCDIPDSPRWQLQTFLYDRDLVCQDNDRDGYGVANIAYCDHQDQIDCDDNDDGINPGEEEVCGNEIDEDCSGSDEVCEEGENGEINDEDESDCVNQDGDDYDTCSLGEAGDDGRPSDCDDSVSFINPGALETCDGNDNNCNIFVDEGCDDDSDGYCDQNLLFFNAPLEICPNSLDDTLLDCNDRSGDYHPGASELCDGRDNDCDGQADEGAACCVDVDEDGYNNCPPSLDGDDGEETDCDNNDPDIFPDQEEVCDGVDNNCNNQIDEEDVCCTDSDQDGYDNCEIGELGDDGQALDCEDGVYAVNPGALETCDGVDNNCDGETDDNGCSCLSGQERNCGSDVGECQSGTQYCVSGSWGECVGEIKEEVEICDGLDNNCNGEDDDDCDTESPVVHSFVVREQDEGEVRANFTVTDNHALAQVELWRTDDLSGAPDSERWQMVNSAEISALQYIGALSDFPEDGIYWYGIHVSDGVNWGEEPNGPIQVLISACQDNDRDGFDNCALGEIGDDENELDCDDDEEYAHPGGTETCDTVDNDCNGEVDEICDKDGDRYCDSEEIIYRNNSMCENSVIVSSGQRGDDCDDLDADINPDAREECDGVNNNCNSQIDENCSCISGDEQDCGSSVGLCQSGRRECIDGEWGDCVGEVGPQDEVCDDEDNDCDDQVDNDCDKTDPLVESFSAELVEAGVVDDNYVGISYRVSDDYALKQVELFRTVDLEGAPNHAAWQRIGIYPVSGIAYEGSLTDFPDSGIYWYGIHVVDQYDNRASEESPIRIVFSFCQDFDGDDFDNCSLGQDGDDGKELDCDDNDDDINPGEEEVCGNDIDEDCDGREEQCDSMPPLVNEFSVELVPDEQLSYSLGTVQVRWSAHDYSSGIIQKVETRRAAVIPGQCDTSILTNCAWEVVDTFLGPATIVSDYLYFDSPPNGEYYYSVLAYDSSDNTGREEDPPGPLRVTVDLDTSAPEIYQFVVMPSSSSFLREGELAESMYRVGDDHNLAIVEFQRARDNGDNAPDENDWYTVDQEEPVGNEYAEGRLINTPPIGKSWYRLRVLDEHGNETISEESFDVTVVGFAPTVLLPPQSNEVFLPGEVVKMQIEVNETVSGVRGQVMIGGNLYSLAFGDNGVYADQASGDNIWGFPTSFSYPGDYSINITVTDASNQIHEYPDLIQFRVANAASVPSAFDWRDYEGDNYMTPVKDQGSCGSCYAFVIAGVAEAKYKIQNNVPDSEIDLSEQYYVSDCCTLNNGCENGNTNSFECGTVTEACYPYRTSNSSCSDRCSDWEGNFFNTSYGSFFPAGSLDDSELKHLIMTHGPVYGSVQLNNFVALPDFEYTCSGSSYSHGLVILGWNDAEGHWIVKNSWGIDWGDNGFAYIPYNNCALRGKYALRGIN